MEKIHWVGGINKDSLTKEELEKLTLLVENTPGLVGLNVYSNLDCTSDDDIPSGISLHMDPRTVVDPTLISDRLFETRAVAKILKGPKGKELDDAHFKAVNIHQSVEQHPEDAPHARIMEAGGKEVEQWSSELGGPGSFVGAFYESDPDDHDVHTYYLVAQGTVPLLVQDFKKEIAERAPTFGDLAMRGEWTKRMQNLGYVANRNVCRNLANLASDAQVSIRREQDLGARDSLDSPHQGLPTRAAPEFSQATHTISTGIYHGKPVVVMYNGVVPRQVAQRQGKGAFFVATNPSTGLYKFHLSKQAEVPAIPVSVRKNYSVSRPQAGEKKRIQSRLRKVTWEQQDKYPMHNDILPSAYQKMDRTFKNGMKQAGWDSDTSQPVVMTPLQVKLYHPSIRR